MHLHFNTPLGRLTIFFDKVEAAASLTDYAVLTRYPSNFEPITEEEYRESVYLAEAVLHWAEALIQP